MWKHFIQACAETHFNRSNILADDVKMPIATTFEMKIKSLIMNITAKANDTNDILQTFR